MGEELTRPYEISLWENQLVTEDGDSYYKEEKIAVIGSNTMTAPIKAYSPVFKKKVNGEKTLTFSLAYKYYDDEVGDFVVNPFTRYLVNERIVKLHYDDEWYDFVIKECEENSETYEFTYTATDAFIQELGKTGYNITFNTELGNNLGTVTQLGNTILENTDWTVDEENSDLLQQKVSEPIYNCTVTTGTLTVKNVTTNEEVTIAQGETIWVFYYYLANKDTNYVQFLRQSDSNTWIYDDNNAIIGTNYRIMSAVEYHGDDYFTVNGARVDIGAANMQSHGYRLVYNQKTIYDSVMKRTVNRYIANYEHDKQEIYEYDDYIYTSSNIVNSFVTNGANFNIYSSGTVQGWSNANYITGNKLRSYNLVTLPRLDANTTLVPLSQLSRIRGFLELDCTGAAGTPENNYANAFFNSGFKNNIELINHISKGEKYVFRIRYSQSTNKATALSDLTPVGTSGASVRGVVAKYTTESQILEDGTIVELKKVDTKNIYLNFNGAYTIGNNIIEGGEVSSDGKLYIIDSVAQTPSLKYVYIDKADNNSYVWDPDKEKYVAYNSSTYSNYLYTVASAQKSMTKEEMTDVDNHFGIFLYDGSNDPHYIYVEEVEIFKYVDSEDGHGTPIMPGNAPEAKSKKIEVFYLKPESGLTKDQINTYNSLSDIAADLGLPESKIVSLRNENCEKVLSIEEQKSNCFNLLQSLCETFECWLDIRVEHDENGAIKLDENYKPIKKVAFKEYIGKENFSGFKYGINLKSIERSLDSNEFVTKLIIGEPVSDYTNSGVLTITEAKSNPNKESYIINLNYYLNQGLIENRTQCLNHLNRFNLDVLQLNDNLSELNKLYRQASGVFTNVSAQRNVYVETYDQAQEEYVQALNDFEQAVGSTYEAYIEKEGADGEILKNDNISKIVGRIYESSTILNTYGGIVTNIKNEYNRLNLLINGAETYGVVVSTIEQEGAQEGATKLALTHYIEGFSCTFIDEDGHAGESFTSEINLKDFTSDTVYNILQINSIPQDYLIEYTDSRGTVIYDEPTMVSFAIRSEGEGGLSKRFRLIPNETLVQKKGYKKLIEEAQEAKQERVNQFNSQYSRFLQEGTWESNNYIDPELYYLDAVEVSNTSAQPRVSYEIGVVEISEIEGFENYSFDVGDKTYIEDTEFFGYRVETIGGVDFKTPVQEEVVVSEVEWHLDEPQNNVIVVQNYKTQFEDLFQRISASVQTLNYNQASYTRAANILDENGRIKAGILARSLDAAAGSESYSLTGNGIIQIVEDGLLVQDLTSMENLLIIKSGGISLSTDGGLTWTKAIGAEGINASVVNAGMINTNQIMIMDGDNPSFRWDTTGLNAYGFGNDGYDLKTYVRFDKYGLYGIKNGEDYVCTSLDDIKARAHFGVTWDGFFIKNNYTNGYVSISSDNDFQVIRNIDNREVEKIKIGALDFNAYGNPTKYGIRIKNDAGVTVMETGDDGNLTLSGTINANAGNIGGMSVDSNKLTMQSIVFEPGVGIYSTRQVVVDDGIERRSEPIFFISDTQNGGNAIFNNIKARGEINATSGNFTGKVTIGRNVRDWNKTYIEIDGINALIKTSNYQDGASYGWMINKDGDAVFNNITARGAIKTAVFEYAEIQAVGGVFLFRPSSPIKAAKVSYVATTDTTVDTEKMYYRYDSEEQTYSEVDREEEFENPQEEGFYELGDLIVRVEKPLLFVRIKYEISADTEVDAEKTYYEKTNYGYEEIAEPTGNPHEQNYYEISQTNVGSWCKVSNYITDGLPSDSTIQNILVTNGLTHVYEIGAIDFDTNEITLLDAGKMVDPIGGVTTLEELEGGSLIDMGRENTDAGYDGGVHNYGIGINSSDNTVNLPGRAISLFETMINPSQSMKVTYDLKGILGTLPELPPGKAKDSIYKTYMAGTQGIYTDNMYLGGPNEYIAFYTQNNNKKLDIVTSTVVVGAEGYIQSSNYVRGSNTKFASSGTKIDLTTGEIYTPYFRLSQGLDNLNAGAYVHGTIEALDGFIGSDLINYWDIGNYTDYNLHNTAKLIGHGSSFIQLGDSLTWRLATNRIHTGWYISTDSYLHFPQFTDGTNNKYWDYGIHVPTSKNDKFLYIRNANASTSLSNLIYDLEDDFATHYWTYKFSIDGEGNVRAKNFYIGDSSIPIGGGTGTIAERIINPDGTFGKGSTTNPIYLDSNGRPQVITDGTNPITIAKSVPSNAVFTDHITSASTSGNGNAVTSITSDANGNLSVVKGSTFLTSFTETDPTVPSWAKQATKPSYTYSEINGTVPASALPSYVDDVLEYNTKNDFPTTGESGKIYIAIDTNKVYRWSGSTYVEISASLVLGETSSTAYRGDRGKVAYNHATAKGSAYASGLYKITTNAEGHVISATLAQGSDIPDITKAQINDFPTTWAWTNITGAEDLQAIEALSGSSGFLKKTATNTWTLDTHTYLTNESDPVFTASAAYGITGSDITNWNNKTSNTGTVTSVKIQGTDGLTGSGTVTTSGTITIKHATGSGTSSENSGRTYIQSVTLDSYGHVTGLTTATETVTNTHYTTHLYVGKSNSTGNAATTINEDTYLRLFDNTTARESHKLSGSNGLTISSTSSGDITFASPIAFTNATVVTVDDKNYVRFTKSDGNTQDLDIEDISIIQAQGATKLVNNDGTALNVDGPIYFNNGIPVSMKPASSSGLFLKDNGTWDSPIGTTYTAGTGLSLTNNQFNVKLGYTTSGNNRKVQADSNGNLYVTQKDNNTTYTFVGGTNEFTVTPSGGSAQTVTITPSIMNNVTGSGTSGYIAKWNGTNTITNGPAFGSSTTTYLRNDGSWGTPTGIIPDSTGNSTTGITIADHSTTTIYGVGSSTTSVYGVKSGGNSTTTASHVKSGGNGTAPSLTISSVACDDITAWNAGSGSASLTLAMDTTDTKKLKITFSHSHTAPSLSYTARSVGSASGWSAGSASNWTFENVTVPIRADSATTVPIKNTNTTTVVTTNTHTITDNGHTHTI